MSGAGFLAGTTSPANTVTCRAVSGPTARASVARTDGAADVEATATSQPRREGLPHQPGHPRPGRDRAPRHQVQVDLGLAAVPGGDGGPLPLGVGGQPGRRDELGGEQAGQALLAAADEDLLLVLVDRPPDGQPELLEGLVERDQVAVQLGVGEHAVAVEDER